MNNPSQPTPHMTITFKLEPDDLRAFYRYAQKHLPNGRRARYINMLVVIAFPLYLTLITEDHRIGFRIVYFCVLLFSYWLLMAGLMFLISRITQWRTLTADKHKSVLCEHTVTLTDDALIDATPLAESRGRWNGIYRVVETVGYIYIFTTLHAACIIPKRAFSNLGDARQFYERATRLRAEANPIS